MSSKTPETDAEIQRNHMAGHGKEFVRPYFARQLESEVVALRAQVADMEIRHAAVMLHTQTVVDENTKLLAELES